MGIGLFLFIVWSILYLHTPPGESTVSRILNFLIVCRAISKLILWVTWPFSGPSNTQAQIHNLKSKQSEGKLNSKTQKGSYELPYKSEDKLKDANLAPKPRYINLKIDLSRPKQATAHSNISPLIITPDSDSSKKPSTSRAQNNRSDSPTAPDINPTWLSPIRICDSPVEIHVDTPAPCLDTIYYPSEYPPSSEPGPTPLPNQQPPPPNQALQPKVEAGTNSPPTPL